MKMKYWIIEKKKEKKSKKYIYSDVKNSNSQSQAYAILKSNSIPMSQESFLF